MLAQLGLPLTGQAEIPVKPRRTGPRKPRNKTVRIRSVATVEDIGQTAFWKFKHPIMRPKSLYATLPLSREEITFGKQVSLNDPPIRHLKVYEECPDEGPCPFASCRHHLGIEVSAVGSLQLNFPRWDMDELAETCSLRAAERGPHTLKEIGEMVNLTDEWVSELERAAVRKVAEKLELTVAEAREVLAKMGNE